MSSKEANRLKALVSELGTPMDLSPDEGEAIPAPHRETRGRPRKRGYVANPPRGERGDFVKMTFMLSPELVKLLIDETAHRKIARAKDKTARDATTYSSIVRDALMHYFRDGGMETAAATVPQSPNAQAEDAHPIAAPIAHDIASVDWAARKEETDRHAISATLETHRAHAETQAKRRSKIFSGS
jgi:hypothetical protein